jgi:two-component system, NtrC family, sensor histidine kinase HydH
MSAAELLARWADRGAIVVASLAAIALALTVLVARADLVAASEATVRGEGEVLVERVHEGLDPRSGPPTRARLEAELDHLQDSGLRYLEVRLGGTVSSAGVSTIASDGLGPGAVRTRGALALMVTPLPRPPPHFLLGPPDPGAPPPPPPFDRPGNDAVLLMEFAPAVLPRLQSAMNRTAAVGAVAVVVLLAFAAVLTVRAVRRTRDEQRAEHQRRLAALGQMSSVMAHELRNPLTSLKGNAQLLAEMLHAGTREHTKAELVVREAQRLEKLTQDLLIFVRDGELSRAHVTPAALLARTMDGLPDERIALDLTGAPETLWVDESRMATALGNLIRNALQSTSNDTRVEVRVHSEASAAVVDVRDHGPGIAPGDAERIFEPFFTTRIHGTGLGLAVARRAIEQHGGTLRAESPAGGGALFRVILPNARLQA